MQELVKLFKQVHKTTIAYGSIRNNCAVPAREFVKFVKPYGYSVRQIYGEFVVDCPEFHFDDFTGHEKTDMLLHGFDPHCLEDRIKYSEINNLVEELKKVPHFWNEFNDEIIDFTAEAQFVWTGLASDTNRNRYIK